MQYVWKHVQALQVFMMVIVMIFVYCKFVLLYSFSGGCRHDAGACRVTPFDRRGPLSFILHDNEEIERDYALWKPRTFPILRVEHFWTRELMLATL